MQVYLLLPRLLDEGTLRPLALICIWTGPRPSMFFSLPGLSCDDDDDDDDDDDVATAIDIEVLAAGGEGEV